MSTPETPATPPNPHKVRNFFIGLGLGLIPGILAMIGFGGIFHPTNSLAQSLIGFAFLAGLVLWLGEVIAWGVLLSRKDRVSMGLGVLIAWLISPVFAFIGCVASLSAHPI
jgi:hypothetical protein